MSDTREVELLRKEDAVSPRVIAGDTFTVTNVRQIRVDATDPAYFHWVELTMADGSVEEYNDVHIMNSGGLYR